MAKRAASATATLARRAPVDRSKRIEALLGRDWKVALVFVLPMVVLMAGLIFWPFINAILLSLTIRNIVTRTEQFVGLRNYLLLWKDADFRGAVDNTILFTVASVACKFVVGMTIALLLNSKLPFRNVLTGVMLLPWIVPEVVTAMAWRSIYDPIFGGLNPILLQLGLIDHPRGWLSEPQLAMPSVDGADVIARFRHITLPGLKYVILVTVLLSTISTFNTFGLVYLMTGGGPGGVTRLYSILAYERAIIGLRFGPGAAVAFSMAPILALVILLLARFMRRDAAAGSNETSVDRAFAWAGRWIVPALAVVVVLYLAWTGSVVTTILRLVWWVLTALLVVGVVRLLAFALEHGMARLKTAARQRLSVALRVLLLLPMLFFVLFPFYWIIITSFKTDLQIQQYTSIFWPNPWTIEQFQTLLFKTPFLTWFRNTVIVATSSTAIAVGLAALAGYALARLKFLGANTLTTVLLITYLLPGSLLFIPLYRILTNLGIINTYMALIATYPTFLMPFATWVMLGYYRSIPEDLEDAAMIDGATRLGAFWRITLPLAAPALLSVTLFAFTNAWNEFLFAFVFITSESLKTLPVGLQLLVFGDIYPWGQLMGASLLMAIPVMLVYIYAQRYLVEGLTAGSVKG